MKPFLIFIISLGSHLVYSQSFNVMELEEDYAYLIDKIEEINPALEAYNPNFEKEANAVMGSVESELNLLDHFANVSRIVCQSNEGHFGLGNWQDTLHKGFLNNSFSYLPLHVKVLNKRLFIWNNYSSSDLAHKGDEILSINGKSTAEVINELFQYIPSDGQIETYKEKQLGSGFNWMYYLYLGQPKQFKLILKGYESKQEKEVEISAITRSEMGRNYKSRNTTPTVKEEKAGQQEVFENSIGDSYALLTLKTFNRAKLEKHDIKAAKLFKSIFKDYQEREVRHLIIDLRDNSGGRKEFPIGILPFVLQQDKKGIYQTAISWKGKEKNYKLPSKSKYAFTGTIYVLVNGGTYSAGSVMARYLKEYGNAIVIGDETGTRYEGFAAGSEEIIFLPHSGFRISIPRYWKKFPESDVQKTTNKGLLPNYSVKYTIRDLMEKKDLEMEKATELIQKG
jgi:C-terminal processing protease CtpA/Prc